MKADLRLLCINKQILHRWSLKQKCKTNHPPSLWTAIDRYIVLTFLCCKSFHVLKNIFSVYFPPKIDLNAKEKLVLRRSLGNIIIDCPPPPPHVIYHTIPIKAGYTNLWMNPLHSSKISEVENRFLEIFCWLIWCQVGSGYSCDQNTASAPNILEE